MNALRRDQSLKVRPLKEIATLALVIGELISLAWRATYGFRLSP
jgi:hypothetical protein